MRGLKAIFYLYSMAQLNMMEEKFHAHRMEECTRATYFAMCREMDHEQKEKREVERARKHEKVRRAKEAFARGGDKAVMKGKWSHLTQD
jgi:hypothetical protein